mgnify:CR=1 FL=1
MSRVKAILSYFPNRLASLFFLISVALLFVNNLTPSHTKELWVYSYFKTFSLILLIFVLIYLIFSLFIKSFSNLNKLVLIAIFFNLFLIEVIFQLFPALIPIDILKLVPPTLRENVADKRGLMTEKSMMGEGMAYSRNPKYYNKHAKPWARVDADGFRNPRRPEDTDIVILGDSVLFSKQVKRDLASRFREIGTPAYNLAIGGYGPFNYLDAYNKYVILRKISHKRVFIFLSLANDFLDSYRYLNIKKGGGDFRSRWRSC